MPRLYFTVCACSATICARKSTFGVLRLFTHLGIVILRFFVSWVDNSCVHSLEKSMDDPKQTIIAAREARLCRYRERYQNLVSYLLTQSLPSGIAKMKSETSRTRPRLTSGMSKVRENLVIQMYSYYR